MKVSNKVTVRRGDLKVSLTEYENDEVVKCQDIMFVIIDALLGMGYPARAISDAFDLAAWEYGWRDDDETFVL